MDLEPYLIILFGAFVSLLGYLLKDVKTGIKELTNSIHTLDKSIDGLRINFEKHIENHK